MTLAFLYLWFLFSFQITLNWMLPIFYFVKALLFVICLFQINSLTYASCEISEILIPKNDQKNSKNQQPTNCLNVFDHFMGLTLKGLRTIRLHKQFTWHHFLSVFCWMSGRSCACYVWQFLQPGFSCRCICCWSRRRTCLQFFSKNGG